MLKLRQRTWIGSCTLQELRADLEQEEGPLPQHASRRPARKRKAPSPSTPSPVAHSGRASPPTEPSAEPAHTHALPNGCNGVHTSHAEADEPEHEEGAETASEAAPEQQEGAAAAAEALHPSHAAPALLVDEVAVPGSAAEAPPQAAEPQLPVAAVQGSLSAPVVELEVQAAAAVCEPEQVSNPEQMEVAAPPAAAAELPAAQVEAAAEEAGVPADSSSLLEEPMPESVPAEAQAEGADLMQVEAAQQEAAAPSAQPASKKAPVPSARTPSVPDRQQYARKVCP